ncbi:MAG: hypothetical protein VB078_10960 [Clostridiaceae bacterium]|nr:hypothetical protein [Clostridiaceae bacterium]
MKIRVSDTPFIGKSMQNCDKLLRRRFCIKLWLELHLTDTSLNERADHLVNVQTVAEECVGTAVPVDLNPIGKPYEVVSDSVRYDIRNLSNKRNKNQDASALSGKVSKKSP